MFKMIHSACLYFKKAQDLLYYKFFGAGKRTL